MNLNSAESVARNKTCVVIVVWYLNLIIIYINSVVTAALNVVYMLFTYCSSLKFYFLPSEVKPMK